MNKSLILGAVITVVLAIILPIYLIGADGKDLKTDPLAKNYSFFIPGDNSLLAPNELSLTRSMEVIITAYSSTKDQTDEDPFITASGYHVRPGIVAANFLPFGTKIRIPEFFGNEIFVVKDRMHPRNDGKVDIWFPTREQALYFGIQRSRIEIL